VTFGIVGTAVVLIGGLIAVGLLTRDRRYTGTRANAGADRFLPTSEVFVDPTSGRRVRVWVDPGTGRRQYREEPDPDAPSEAGGVHVEEKGTERED
jgi:hypothetical protein